MGRKTKTSYEVKRRWDTANLCRYAVSLRADEDQQLIQYIEEHKKEIGTTEIFRQALKEYIKDRG